MKLIILMVVFTGNNCFGQCDKSKSFYATLFCKTLSKQIDTIYFKATYMGIGKISQSDYINKLDAKRVINKKNYTSAIEFVPLGSTQNLYLPLNDVLNETNNEKLNIYGSKKTICIRGIVYKGYEKWKKTIFFLVDRIEFL